MTLEEGLGATSLLQGEDVQVPLQTSLTAPQQGWGQAAYFATSEAHSQLNHPDPQRGVCITTSRDESPF